MDMPDSIADWALRAELKDAETDAAEAQHAVDTVDPALPDDYRAKLRGRLAVARRRVRDLRTRENARCPA